MYTTQSSSQNLSKTPQTYSGFLCTKHQADIQARGLLNDWARAACRTVTKEEASFLLGYEAKSGGIWISGQTLQGQLRPDKPWKSDKDPASKKAPKYRTPLTDHGCDAIVPSHPTDKNYWEPENLKQVCYQINGHPCLVLTEGPFQTLAGCSNNLPTIGLTGVENGLTGKNDDVQGKRYLIPTLEKNARAGFGFIFAFDADAAVNPNVAWAQRKLGHQLLKFNIPVYVATGNWEMGSDGETKGMDDLIQKKGIEAFRKALSKSNNFKDWESETFDGEGANSKLPSSDAMARQIAEDYRDKLAFNNEVLCWYRYEAESPGIWAPETDEYVESIVYQIIKSKGLINLPPSYVGATLRFLRHELIERKWKAKAGLLPFQNGALEIATGKLHPHSPGYKFTWSLPRPHSIVDAEWGKIREWLDFATHNNSHVKNLLLAFAAATLKGRADIQKFLHLIGIGGSGKGTFFHLLMALIGIENCHTTTLEDWCTNRFEVAQAYSKRLVVFPDEDKGVRSLGKFKQLTGGDWLRAEEKGKKPFKFKFEGMVVVASNFPIFGADNSSGMSRRTIAVPFDAMVARNARRSLIDEFTPELAAFTNYLLSLDDAWVENTLRGVMEIPEIGAQFWESKIREDSIAGFLNDKLILDPLAQVAIGDSPNAQDSLYQAYYQYCSDQGHRPQAVKNFSPNLIECASAILGWQVEKVHTKVGKIIKGLRLRTEGDRHIATYDYELRSRCEKPGDGFGDGLVTDTVTGQNPELEPITAPVTDSAYSRVEKNIEVDRRRCEEITSTGVSIDQSPDAKPLSVKTPDPSPQPSPQPSPNPSPSSTVKLGDRVKITEEYPGLETLIGVKATVVDDLGKGDFEIKFDAEVEILGGKPKKSLVISDDYLLRVPPVAAPTNSPKKFQLGDRVKIIQGLHRDREGTLKDFGSNATETEYQITLDKPSHGQTEVVITVAHSEKFPVLMPAPVPKTKTDLPSQPEIDLSIPF
ncbi:MULTISPECIES: phage/plasmid primase, P4 family [unclassified Microcoleus]|uniref:phage/plasmid primase, P4 family n=1 Tax=unclassified Microcoleus TaxID=2642155 RepID=UPI002FD75FF2